MAKAPNGGWRLKQTGSDHHGKNMHANVIPGNAIRRASKAATVKTRHSAHGKSVDSPGGNGTSAC